MNPRGYVSASSQIWHNDIQMGKNIFIGNRVVIYQNENGGPIKIGKNSKLCDDVVMETGDGGSITIGESTRCQFRCHLAAYKSSIIIGNNVGIAQGCSFYSHDHGRSSNENNKLTSKGMIVIEDGVWLGAGVTVLSGAHIGKESVIAAGSVVTGAVPPGAIAAGVPAKIVKMRD